MTPWDLYRVADDRSIRWAELVDPDEERPQFLPERLASEALLRGDLVIERLARDEAEVFRADAVDGSTLDVVFFAAEGETLIMVAPARPHSSGLTRLAFVYSALARSRDAVVFTDATGAILGASAQWRELYGYLPAEVLGRNPRLVNSRRHSKAFFRRLWLDLTRREVGSWSGELENRRRNGDLVTVWQTITTFLDATGSIAGYLGITRDLTARRELVARLARAQDLLEPQEHMAARRIVETALDLRSPLNTVDEHLELALASASGDSRLAGHLEAARRAAQNLQSLVARLLEQGAEPSPGAVVDLRRAFLRSMVRTWLESCSVAVARRGVEIALREEGPSLPCFLDDTLLGRALGSALGFALGRTARGGSVEVLVRTDAERGYQEIVVEDQGPKLAPAELTAMLGADSDRAAAVNGDAAATRSSPARRDLEVARQAVERHGGSVHGKPGSTAGCRIALRLPIDYGKFEQRPWAVVVFDPAESVWSTGAEVLQASGIPSFLAHDETELRHVFEHELPNVILCAPGHPVPAACQDYELPAGTGTLRPAVCELRPIAGSSSFQVQATAGAEGLASQVAALFAPEDAN